MFKPSNHSKSNEASRHAPRLLLGMILLASAGVPGATYAELPPSANQQVPRTDTASPSDDPTSEFGRYSISLHDLGITKPIELRSVDGQSYLPFSLRNDEVITGAKLKLSYAWSPALIPELSHLKVMLNDELMASLPLPHENNDGTMREVQLDPSLLVDFNQLRFELIAHYTRDCEDPMHSSLWANVSNQSRLELTVRRLQLPNDLSQLPAPFFDKLDKRKLELPFVFTAQPNNEMLQTAGVVASWFGSLASYRGAHFPVQLNTIPTGNAVLIVMGSTAPEELALPPVNGASLAMITNPANPNAKLLVVMGRNAAELALAAQALTLGNTSLNGNLVEVGQLQNIPPRKPYDAPNWIPTDRPVHFGELTQSEALQAEGFTPDAIRVNFNLPPDIFSWQSKGVPLDLRYRYTQRPTADKSTLNVNVNESFVRSLPLTSVPGKFEKLANTVLQQDGKVVSEERVYLPHEKVFGQNQLQFRYFFDYTKQGSCKDVFLYNERGAIDPDSSIDFSSFPHYTALPNLSFFVNDGFPYTRMADLSETAVVMPNNASLPEMETYLQMMGRMGKITGYPAIRHQLVSAANVEASANKDLIVIGTAANQPLLERWADQMHPLLESGTHKLRLPGPFERLVSRWDNRDLEDAMKRAGDLVTKGASGLGTLVAFESPLQRGRSIVVLTGDTPEQIAALAMSASDPKTMERFHGDLALHSGDRIESFQLGPSYYVGNLPWWTALRWYFAKQPLLLAGLIAVAALLIAILAYRALRKLAARRLAKHDVMS
jgi:hypothetical protein